MATDLEMDIVDNDTAVPTAKRQLSYALFGINDASQRLWPGLDAYMNFVEGQMKHCDPTCYQALWGVFHFALPVRVEDQFSFLRNIATMLCGERQQWTIDGILQKLLASSGSSLQDLDVASHNLCRQAVFNAASWLLSLFVVSVEGNARRFKIKVPSGVVGFRDSQDIAMSSRPIYRMCREFGPLLPGSRETAAVVEDKYPIMLHASNLNAASLKIISKVRIVWTESLGYHLWFNPLKRTLMVYRFPTFCALNCLRGRNNSAFNSSEVMLNLSSLLHEQSLVSDSASELDAFQREVIMSYRVLFGQRSSSRHEFRRSEKRRVTALTGQYDPLLDILCGEPNGPRLRSLPPDIWPESALDENNGLLEQDAYTSSIDFPLLSSRMRQVQEFDLRQQPNKIRDLWRDRRNPLQWYAFWVVLIVGGAAVLLGVFQLAVACITLAYQAR